MVLITGHRNWEADPITGPQRAMILKHKLATNVELNGFTKGQASVLISKFLDERKKNEPGLSASQAQIDLITLLVGRLGLDPEDYPLDNVTKKNASTMLTELKSYGDPVDPDLTEGIYMLDGEVFKLRQGEHKHFSVWRLVKLAEVELVSNGVRTHKWHRSNVRLARFSVSNRCTKEQAQAFAGATSTCIRCGVRLEETITQADGSPRWIGPVCAQKMGW